MADLADLAALKLQLESEAGSVGEGVSSNSSGVSLNEASMGDSQPSAEVSEVVLAAVLRHTPMEASELHPQLSFAQLGIGKLARWAIASTIETELHISVADIEIESWDSVSDILISAQEK